MRVYATTEHPIPLGFTGENEVRTVCFKIAGILKDYPDAEFSLTHRRNGDKARPASSGDTNVQYECVTYIENDLLCWDVTRADTDKAGVGKVQLTFTSKEGNVGKSIVFKTNVEPSMGEPLGPAPEPYENWIGDIRERISSMTEIAESAKEAASRAEAEVETYDPLKQLMPAEQATVGRTLKVKSVNPDGTFVCEWATGADVSRESIEEALGYTPASQASIDNKVDKEEGKGLFSGSYNDLRNKPTIPSAYNDAELRGLIANKVDKETDKGLFSGSYNDLTNKPDTEIGNKVDKSQIDENYGLRFLNTGSKTVLTVNAPTETQIAARDEYHPLTPGTVGYAIRDDLTGNNGVPWSTEQQAAFRSKAGITDAPLAKTNVEGISKPGDGLKIETDGVMTTDAATIADIENRTPGANVGASSGNTRKSITPATVDYAVESVLSDMKTTFDTDKQKAIWNKLGFDLVVEHFTVPTTQSYHGINNPSGYYLVFGVVRYTGDTWYVKTIHRSASSHNYTLIYDGNIPAGTIIDLYWIKFRDGGSVRP